METNLLSVIDLADKLPTPEGLDAIYQIFHTKLTAGLFAEVDEALRQVKVDDQKTDILIGILTITSYARDRLVERSAFYLRARESIIRRGENDEPGLFDGLE